MRFANVLLASMILSAAFGSALAQIADQAPSAAPPSHRAELLSPSFTWLWQPPMRRVASAY